MVRLLEDFCFTLLILVVAILLFPVILIVTIYGEIKFLGKPKECCKAGCNGCPWGDITCIGYRGKYRNFKKNNPDYRNRPNYKLG